MSNIWEPAPGGVWDSFFREAGFDNGDSEDDEDLQCIPLLPFWNVLPSWP